MTENTYIFCMNLKSLKYNESALDETSYHNVIPISCFFFDKRNEQKLALYKFKILTQFLEKNCIVWKAWRS